MTGSLVEKLYINIHCHDTKASKLLITNKKFFVE